MKSIPAFRTAVTKLLTLILLLMLAIVSTENVVYAAGEDLDVAFDTDGKVTTNKGSRDDGWATAITSHGKILVGGTDGSSFVLLRYNTDGSLDTFFGVNGIVTTNFGSTDRIKGLVIDAHGKIIAAGTSGNDIAVARYNSNGTLDTSFSGDGMQTVDFNSIPGSYTTAEGTAVAIDGNSKIVIVGYVRNGSEYNDFALVRLHSNGLLDTTFNSGGGAPGIVTTSVQSQEEDQAHGVVIQPDGKIVVVGDTRGAPGRFVMLRYHSSGLLDNSFSGDGKVYAASNKVSTGYGVALHEHGWIVVVGAKSVTDPSSDNCLDSAGKYCEYSDLWVARFSSNGSPETSFGNGGEVTTNINSRGNDDHGRAIVVLPNGKILAVGHSDMSIHTFSGEDEFFTRSDDFSLVRYNRDGSLDTSFGSDGKTTTDFNSESYDEGFATALQSDGKIIVAGTSDRDFALARYDPDGETCYAIRTHGKKAVVFCL